MRDVTPSLIGWTHTQNDPWLWQPSVHPETIKPSPPVSLSNFQSMCSCCLSSGTSFVVITSSRCSFQCCVMIQIQGRFHWTLWQTCYNTIITVPLHEHHVIWNHRQFNWLSNSLLKLTSKETSKLNLKLSYGVFIPMQWRGGSMWEVGSWKLKPSNPLTHA